MPSPTQSTATAPPSTPGGRSAAWLPSHPAAWRKLAVFALSLATLAAITYFAIRQHAPPQFENSTPSFFSWNWWLLPHEQNPALRPAATDQSLESTFFVTPESGWAVGWDGIILHTEDGGKVWNRQPSNTRAWLNSVFFVTPRSGWVVGEHGTILHTADGGASWSPQSSSANAETSLRSVFFVTPESGWIAGFNIVLHTDDGGRTWNQQSSNTGELLNSVFFVTPQSGWTVGENGTILRTENAGRTWKPQTSKIRSALLSVFFPTPQSGWAVGRLTTGTSFPSHGVMLHTEDGGKSWNQPSSNAIEALNSVFFVTPQSGWITGDDGTILRTEDSGKHWNRQSGGPAALNSIRFATPQTGWIVGSNGTILRTVNGGQSWNPQSSSLGVWLNSVFFATPQFGWALGGTGIILHTEDGGRSWIQQFRDPGVWLSSVFFVTPQSGWAVGANGTILHTEDGGRSWNQQPSNAKEILRSVFFPTPLSGWVVGDSGIILGTRNGGRSWDPLLRGTTNATLLSVFFATPQSGWIVGDLGTILHTEDGGIGWNRQASNTKEFLLSVFFATPQSGWAAVFNKRFILHTEDGGRRWKPQPTGGLLSSVFFVTPQSGWGVGAGGTVLHTGDGGRNWNEQSIDITDNLSSVFFPTMKTGVAVGGVGTILRTDDGGQTWSQAGYRRWLPPWFYLGVFFCCVALTWACWPPTPPPRPGIEEVANSDSPVVALKDDTLGYAPLVQRLRRFIQNPKTAPPLVLSVQAPWGMGKSSIMRMLESELKEQRAAVTVWFNAWHHQKEDQLLACLMEAVQKQAVPPWFTPVGISFRLDLLRVRLLSNIDRAVLTVLILLAIATGPYWRSLLLPSQKSLPLWATSVCITVSAWALLQPLIAFKSNPEKLMDKARESMWRALRDFVTLSSLIGKSDVRREFASNLKDVVTALDPQRLVIFLDDLDRCRPEQVVQILEAVNFLSSVSACFIFVGADYRKVEALVAKEFEDIAVQEIENNRGDGQSVPVDRVLVRVDYARKYMKKIVNLRINLKHLVAADYVEFFRRRPADTKGNHALLQRFMMVVALGAIAACYVAARQYGPENGFVSPGTAANATTERIAETRTPAAGPDATSKPASGGEKTTPTPPSPPTTGFDRDQIGFEGKWRAILIASVVAAAFVIYRLSRPKRPDEAQDPVTFANALAEKSEAILNKCGTPREVRRFLNYLRLVTAPGDENALNSIQKLREQSQDFDRRLVDLAAGGLSATQTPKSAQAPSQAQAQPEDAVREFYLTQCTLFGINPSTFHPLE